MPWHTTAQVGPQRGLSIALLLSLAAAPAAAHDFWLSPAAWKPSVPSTLAVALRVGDRFPRGETYPRNPAHALRFTIVGPRGSRPVPGRPGDDPAGTVRLDAPGLWVLGYESNPTTIELPPERFEHYLREERQLTVVRERAARGETTRPGREAFARAAKALVLAGEAPDATGHDRVLGLALELVPERSPYAIRPGDTLPIRLLHHGRPLAGALVRAEHAEAPRVEVRTDAGGRARLRLDAAGPWLVRSLHLSRASEGSGADWTSLWASLTFAIGAPPR